mmetsp:Transcript_3620/g.10492  ORF Transcript_3620/g.10492 Transcript_3620/m.10492 type:complete len:269 (+) Transcript_3620:593-1399(+)
MNLLLFYFSSHRPPSRSMHSWNCGIQVLYRHGVPLPTDMGIKSAGEEKVVMCLMAVEDVAVCFQQRSGGMILLFRIPPCLQAHHIEGHFGEVNSAENLKLCALHVQREEVYALQCQVLQHESQRGTGDTWQICRIGLFVPPLAVAGRHVVVDATFSPLLNQGNLALAVADRKIETQCTWSILYQPRKVVWPSLDENSAPAHKMLKEKSVGVAVAVQGAQLQEHAIALVCKEILVCKYILPILAKCATWQPFGLLGWVHGGDVEGVEQR